MHEKKTGNILYGIFLITLTGSVSGYLYRLKMPFVVIMILAEAAVLPVWVKGRKKRELEQERFSDANIYMEQVLYSFRKTPKILSALTDVEKLFPGGNMETCIQKAVEYIRDTYEEEQIMEKSLGIIEAEYPAQRITYIHRLMLKAERLGGDCESSIRILLKDRDIWEKETISYQKCCQTQKRNITAAVLLSVLLCLMTPVLCQGSLKNVSITDSMVYQLSTLILLLVSMGIYLYTEKYFTRDWLQEKAYKSSESSLQKYTKVTQYDFSKARKKSLLWSAPAGILMGILAWSGHWFLTAMTCPIFIFLLFQHRVDYALAKKSVIHEIRKAFPDWLMEVSLLLQTENVANSIQKSMESAPDILKPELQILIEKLEVTPESNLPYSEFLKDFAIPEVASAMGMLYSISDGGGSDAGIQMEEILERNAEWMGQSEALSNQDKIAKMYLLFLLPALLGALKMAVDMTLILLSFFSGVRM